jgi:serine/threonine protein kinase
VESQEQRCVRCGGSLAAGSTGSITQWLRVCHCNVKFEKEPADLASSKLQVCVDCGRRIGDRRLGSLTQWIFRHDCCDCSHPKPRDINEAELDKASIDEPSLVEDERLELEVDLEEWPGTRYKPLSLLGSGGFGTVYRCHDRVLNKTIALKVMRHLTPQQLVSFQYEAKAASRLNHPNIVQVYDFGATESGTPFMTMEFVNGVSLEQWLVNDGTLTVSQAVSVFRKVCNALAHAHRSGVLHRDIKSSNLLLVTDASDELEVKLIDFGAALLQSLEGQNLHARGSTIAGSPNYMPPDQFLGKQYDERSDVYAVGCSLFEALTGRTPFDEEETLETIRKQACLKPPKLSDINPLFVFSSELEEIVAKCLSKDPESRFQSMEELDEALSKLIEEDELLLPDPNPAPASVFASSAESGVSKAPPVVLIVMTVLILASTFVGWTAFVKTTGLAETKVKQAPIPDTQASVSDTASVIIEADKPRFVKMMIGDLPGLVARGSMADEDMVALKGRTDYKSLALAREEITGKGLVYIDAPIIRLSLNHTLLCDQYLPLLKKHKYLESLELEHNNVTDRGLVHLTQIPSLQSLSIGNDRITDSGINSLVHIKYLWRLKLVDAQRVTKVGLQRLSGAPRLEQLGLKGIDLKLHGLSWLPKLSGLRELYLEDCRIDDKLLESLATLRLEKVNLVGNKEINNSGLEKLGHMNRLRVLEIQDSPSVTPEAFEILHRMNPRLEINKLYEAQQLKPRLHKGRFSAPTGSIFKDLIELGDKSSKNSASWTLRSKM